jgi:hypothetical protein
MLGLSYHGKLKKIKYCYRGENHVKLFTSSGKKPTSKERATKILPKTLKDFWP